MIKAGALLYAMFLVIVITIISSSFILINHYNSTYVLHAFKQDQLFKDVYSGINYGLVQHQQIPVNGSITLDLYNDELHNVILSKKYWGAFYHLTAKATWRNSTITKTALAGANINNGEKTALYLADYNKPLSLTGNTTIKGKCFLPKSGIKRAYIEGKSYEGRKLIDGIVKNSNRNLPPINNDLIDINYTHFSLKNTDSIVDYGLFLEQDSIVNSFNNKTLVLYSPYSIVITNKIVEGNIIIKSARNIIVESSSYLNNVLCYANGIVVERNTSANAQFFAQDSIQIGENCALNYPSTVALIAKDPATFQRKITVGENTIINGSVFLINEKKHSKIHAFIALNKDVDIMGEVYSSELLEIKGKVRGSVYCSKLLLRTPSSVYENHLMDVTINRELLSEHFVGAALTEEINLHEIIQWLN